MQSQVSQANQETAHLEQLVQTCLQTVQAIGHCFNNQHICEVIDEISRAIESDRDCHKLLSDLQCTVEMERRKDQYAVREQLEHPNVQESLRLSTQNSLEKPAELVSVRSLTHEQPLPQQKLLLLSRRSTGNE